MAVSFPQGVVLDTNIVLDLLVFSDPASLPLLQALQAGSLQWLATTAMRDELLRVLDYPQIAPRLAYYRLTRDGLMAQFDQQARLVDAAPGVHLRCTDPDDQKFIDLAVAHRALLLSKDQAVLRMAKRLLAVGVRVRAAISAAS
jgi:putative PIN family toxin of toxin-antitoxin system